MNHILVFLNNLIPFSRLCKKDNAKHNYIVLIIAFFGYFIVLSLQTFLSQKNINIIDTSAETFSLIGSDSGPKLCYDKIKIATSSLFVFLIIFSFVIDIYDSVYNGEGKNLYPKKNGKENKNILMQSIISMILIYFFRIIIFNFSILYGYVSLNNINVVKYGISTFQDYDMINDVSSFMNILLISFRFPFSNYDVIPPFNFISVITVLYFSLSTILVWTFLTGSFYFVLTSFRKQMRHEQE